MRHIIMNTNHMSNELFKNIQACRSVGMLFKNTLTVSGSILFRRHPGFEIAAKRVPDAYPGVVPRSDADNRMKFRKP